MQNICSEEVLSDAATKEKKKQYIEIIHWFGLLLLIFKGIARLFRAQPPCQERAELYRRAPSSPTHAWNWSCHYSADFFGCNLGSPMKMFYSSHALPTFLYVRWNDAAVMDSLIWYKWRRRGGRKKKRKEVWGRSRWVETVSRTQNSVAAVVWVKPSGITNLRDFNMHIKREKGGFSCRESWSKKVMSVFLVLNGFDWLF